jgi:hypothetical protein
MKIAVIGAGMAGVAAAQALASDGHDVTVIERRSSVAEETSFAPAGIAAAGLAAPWLPAPGRLQAMAGSADEAARLRGIGAAFATPTLFGKGDGPEAARRAERALALHKLLARASSASTPSPTRWAGLRARRRPAADAGRRRHRRAGRGRRRLAAAGRRDGRMGRRRAPAPDRARPRGGRRRAARRLAAQRARRQHARVDAAAARPRAAPGRALPVPARGRGRSPPARSRRCASPPPASRRARRRSTPSSSAPRSSRRGCSRRWA